MRRFEFSDSTSNKFWEVEVKGKTLNVTFGKIGTKGQNKPKDFATPEKAKAEMEKLIKEKTGKGYVEVGSKAVKAIKPAGGKNNDYESVNRWTRAGRDGREIVCPHCEHVGRVYHFTWNALTCNGCHRSIEKPHWLTPSPNMGEGLSKAENQAKLLEEDLGKGVKLEMVLVPAEKFMMGSPASEKGRYDNETQHEVTLTKSYYMGKYEVTQEQWEAVMGDNPSYTVGAKLPVTDVSWNDCKKFIKKLNGITKGKYRLPTEAEWEYACRAGTSTAYSFGANITPKDANSSESEIGKPVEVGSYKPNAFGLYDMHGNVWEWCEDWYGDYPERSVIDPKGLEKGEERVLRGGSFSSDVSGARSSLRVADSPTDRYSYFGLRLARTAL